MISENVADKEIILESYMATTTGKFSVGKQEMPEEIKKPGFIVRGSIARARVLVARPSKKVRQDSAVIARANISSLSYVYSRCRCTLN